MTGGCSPRAQMLSTAVAMSKKRDAASSLGARDQMWLLDSKVPAALPRLHATPVSLSVVRTWAALMLY